MTNLIMVAGFALAALLAVAMLRPHWRLPALVIAWLALPGNMDNIWPQMRLDPHPIAHGLAPVFTTADLLLVWALLLTLREGRRPHGSIERAWVLGAVGLLALASIAAVISLTAGVEPLAAARGAITFARIPLIVFVLAAHRDQLGDGRLLAAAFAIGLVSLLGNGLYTSTTIEASRFTAATFGRNGFAVALVVASLIAGSLALRLTNAPGATTIRRLALPLVLAGLVAAGLFGAASTGTRMALLVLGPAFVLGLALNRGWRVPGGWMRPTAAALVILVGVGASGLFTIEGQRAISVVIDPGRTVDIITDPESEPDYSPVRTRTRFWDQALAMTREQPLNGVGPFQWNVERYRLDPSAPPVVADPHNTYLQMAAEYGLAVAAAYLVLLAATVGTAFLVAWRRRSVVANAWPATAILVSALVIPLTEMTNSHFFHVRLGPVAWLLFAAAAVLATTTAQGERLGPRLPGRMGREAAASSPSPR